ncbi:MAG: hypothetical protein Q8O72_07285 [Bacteroidales bacterium]|nr:hypothetical protein [Bacteroidales bacterium]
MNLDKIYEVRKNFIVIGLTGRTGAGCSNVTEILEKKFEENDFPKPLSHKDQEHPDDAKYNIAYNYLESNHIPFTVIKYQNILAFFTLKEGYEKIDNFLSSNPKISNLKGVLEEIKGEIDEFHNKIKNLNIITKEESDLKKLNSCFFGSEFLSISKKLHEKLSEKSKVTRHLFLQIVSNNLRQVGNPFDSGDTSDPENVYFIAKFTNLLIKSCREKARDTDNICRIVIDSLRNSLEMNFFKQRYSAFYMISVSRSETVRVEKIRKFFGDDTDIIIGYDNDEHAGSPGEFYKQDVSNCIQKADIHLYNIKEEQAKTESELIGLRIISFKHQIVSYLSLIMQPGIITPSPQERCMQMAYTAKYNSGCISRQVGASITDSNYSIKALGWNNTPEGQIPCLLRNVKDLISNDNNFNPKWYSNYEQSGLSDENHKFIKTLKSVYKKPIEDEGVIKCLSGRNVPYCFKTIINSYQEGKNQVHTRSLHAEENAFLQISKYGGQGINGGFLFTTASPCELCAKKAYQLGIKIIFYIDPYPGITKEHIITCGDENKIPKMMNFYGAIGNAYHWLYEPFMTYKDELDLILGIKIKNENQSLKDDNKNLQEKLDLLGFIYDNETKSFKEKQNGQQNISNNN